MSTSPAHPARAPACPPALLRPPPPLPPRKPRLQAVTNLPPHELRKVTRPTGLVPTLPPTSSIVQQFPARTAPASPSCHIDLALSVRPFAHRLTPSDVTRPASVQQFAPSLVVVSARPYCLCAAPTCAPTSPTTSPPNLRPPLTPGSSTARRASCECAGFLLCIASTEGDSWRRLVRRSRAPQSRGQRPGSSPTSLCPPASARWRAPGQRWRALH